MNPTPLVMLDTIGQAFDEAGVQVAPLITFEFANDLDLFNFLTVFETCLNKYSSNAVVMRVEKNEVNKFNDVLCKFTVRV